MAFCHWVLTVCVPFLARLLFACCVGYVAYMELLRFTDTNIHVQIEGRPASLVIGAARTRTRMALHWWIALALLEFATVESQDGSYTCKCYRIPWPVVCN